LTVLSSQNNPSSSVEQNTRTMKAHDGFKAKLTDKSASHYTSKHGNKFGVDDPLPPLPNQKPTKYKQVRTRLNKENQAKVRKDIESILSNPKSDVYTDVSIRGIQGRIYHCPDTNRIVGIHTEGEFEGQIMKAQPVSDPQLDFLRELNKFDELLNYLTMSMEQKFFKLLAYSNELKKTNKYLQKEDPEAFQVLLKFLVTIEENFHYSEKHEYINLAKDFLDDQITTDDFSRSFMAIYEGIGEKLGQMKREESVELANFLNKTDRCRLNRLLASIYGSCDSFSLDPDFSISDEKELKNCAQILLLKLQEE